MYNPQLETFIRVADAGSFNKAAEALFISPPAVLKQINLLEDSLGLTLFLRTHRGLTLTREGESLYADAKYIVTYCKEAVDRAKSAGRQSDSTIRIGISPMTPSLFIQRLWPKIHKICPDIRFELVPFENTPQSAREILKNLGEHIDIVAGMFDQASLVKWQCEALEIARKPIRCALPVTHPLADKDCLSPEDLHGEQLMIIRRDWNSYLDVMRDELWQNHPQIQVVDIDFFSVKAFNQCEYNHHLMMTIDEWQDIHPMLKVIPVDWDYTVPFGVFHAPSPSPVVAKFLRAVQAVLKQEEL